MLYVNPKVLEQADAMDKQLKFEARRLGISSNRCSAFRWC